MYTFVYDNYNHTFLIQNSDSTKGWNGIHMQLIGDDMAEFLKGLVDEANTAIALRELTEQAALIIEHGDQFGMDREMWLQNYHTSEELS